MPDAVIKTDRAGMVRNMKMKRMQYGVRVPGGSLTYYVEYEEATWIVRKIGEGDKAFQHVDTEGIHIQVGQPLPKNLRDSQAFDI